MALLYVARNKDANVMTNNCLIYLDYPCKEKDREASECKGICKNCESYVHEIHKL